MDKTKEAEALLTLNKIRVEERTPLDNAVLFSRHGEVGKAAIELLSLRAQLAEAVEALRPFAIANPIGVSNQWMPDFERAAAVLAKIGK